MGGSSRLQAALADLRFSSEEASRFAKDETKTPPTSKEINDFVHKYIDDLDPILRHVSQEISRYAELGFHEFKSHSLLVKTLQDLGFEVTTPTILPTAFIATYAHRPIGSSVKGRTMGFNAEYDGLKGIGQACGHNLIAMVGVGAAAGVKAALKHFDLPGSIKLIGTPAEEGGGGKIILLKHGYYSDLDACAMAHPMNDGIGGDGEGKIGEWDGTCTVGKPGSLARTEFSAEFFGRGAHAGANPWTGINALDAAVQGYTAVSMLRQQIRPDQRVHGVITGSEGWVANVIPNYSKVTYDCRSSTLEECLILMDRVIDCFKSAALATGCRISVQKSDEANYAELENNTPLSDAYIRIMQEMFPGYKTEISTGTTASTDFGNVQVEVAGIHPGFWIETVKGGGNHTAEFAKAAATPEAHVLGIKPTKGLASLGLRFLVDDEFSCRVKESFEKRRR